MTKRSGSWHRSADKTKDAEGPRQSMSIRLALTAPTPVRRPRLPVPLNHRPPAVLPPLPRRHGARHVTCRGGRASPAQPELKRAGRLRCDALCRAARHSASATACRPKVRATHPCGSGSGTTSFMAATSAPRLGPIGGSAGLSSPAPSSLQLAAVQSRPSLTLTA
jgi:hypothetical protein